MTNHLVATKNGIEIIRNHNQSSGMISLFLILPKSHILYGRSIDTLKTITGLNAAVAFENRWQDSWYFRFDFADSNKSPFKDSLAIYEDTFAEKLINCAQHQDMVAHVKAQLGVNIDALKQCIGHLDISNHDDLAKNLQNIADLAEISGKLLPILNAK